MVPSAATRTIGVKACWLPTGRLVGVRLTLIGADHVSPPSVERTKAMSSCVKPEKRASCHTA